ncbi:hypothetical protein FB45DRAFT_890152 [Roridomyces roridus]|uniref:Uncharacterized protein n=1 Tax=Roridomyces roridus TaxID=1738132 RepID=A0AAD7CLJ5_9AGAR|nr:hypothetical protein FB45DRAFT_890152 [Roridomyces roridus]
MMTPSNRTYSDFFPSGLRAMAGASYRSPPPSFPSSSPSENLFKLSMRNKALRSLTRRQRTASSPTPTMTLPENTTSWTRTQRRRSSIIDLPYRLLGRIQSRSERRHCDVPISYEKHTILDPFDASQNSTSFFIESMDHSSPNQRPQSFLLLGESTESIFRLRLPIQRSRSRRPTSVQSMPLPSASLQNNPRVIWDKYEHEHEWDWDRDRSWALQEEEEEEEDTSIWIEEEEDPAATIDWRQFHNDLLNEE